MLRSRAVRAALLLVAVVGVRAEVDSDTPAASFESVPALTAAILSHLEGTPCVRLLTTSGPQGCASACPTAVMLAAALPLCLRVSKRGARERMMRAPCVDWLRGDAHLYPPCWVWIAV
jgi:hypothetical protein